jgi:hypothetical protein
MRTGQGFVWPVPCRYVEDEAAALRVSQSAAFATLKGLHLADQPQDHPSYAALFKPEWCSALKERLRLFISAVGQLVSREVCEGEGSMICR